MNFSEKMLLGAEKFGLSIDKGEISKFSQYYALLLEWNEKMNLTSLTEEEEVVEKHFLDSLTCMAIPQIKDCGSLIDVGTGAGFPGIPLKIMYPEKRVTLLDSLKKRVGFLEAVSQELKLEGISAVHGRAEEMGQKKEWRESFDLAVARAVAEMRILTELCLPFVKLGGYFMAMKGPQGEEELKNAEKAITILGGKVESVSWFSLPFTGADRTILLIKKVKSTPPAYPRRPGTPEKKPL